MATKNPPLADLQELSRGLFSSLESSQLVTAPESCTGLEAVTAEGPRCLGGALAGDRELRIAQDGSVSQF